MRERDTFANGVQPCTGARGAGQVAPRLKLNELIDSWVAELEQPAAGTRSRTRRSGRTEGTADAPADHRRGPEPPSAPMEKGEAAAEPPVAQAGLPFPHVPAGPAQPGVPAQPESAEGARGTAVAQALATITELERGPHAVLLGFAAAGAQGAEAERILLRRTGELVTYPGALLARGAQPRLSVLAQQQGASPEQARALEFLVDWFGAPIDALTKTSSGLGWGCFRLSGDALAQALVDWQERAPASFEQQLGRFGVCIVLRGQSPPRLGLTPLEQCGSARAEGSQAEQAVLGSPRLASVFVRAARHPDALAAQLHAAWTFFARPALAAAQARDQEQLEAPEERLSGLRSPRIYGALFLVRWKLQAAADALLRGVLDAEPAFHSELERRLISAGQKELAYQAAWIRCSPELAAPNPARKRSRSAEKEEACG